MKISSKAHYGLQAVFLLAKKQGVLSAKELEKEIGVSGKYLERIMRTLSNAEIVSANRGVQGGYYLTKTPQNTTAGEVVRALEDELEIIGCVNSSCNKCGTSFVWKKLYVGINAILDGITLADMVKEDEILNAFTVECASCKDSNCSACLRAQTSCSNCSERN